MPATGTESDEAPPAATSAGDDVKPRLTKDALAQAEKTKQGQEMAKQYEADSMVKWVSEMRKQQDGQTDLIEGWTRLSDGLSEDGYPGEDVAAKVIEEAQRAKIGFFGSRI